MQTIKNYELKIKRVSITQRFNAITSSDRAAKIAVELIGSSAQETVLAFILDIRNRLVGYTVIGVGAVDGCGADIRQIFRVAVALGASSLILVHNHISGDLVPSEEDIKLTKRILEASKILGIPLLDHIIVSDCNHSSLKEKGLLK